MFDFLTGEALIALLALSAMEIVLGIDNLVFISILTSRLPEESQKSARRLGLGLALVMRIALLFTLSWILALDKPFFHFSDLGFLSEWFADHEHINDVSVKDLFLLAGGLFLIGKSVVEIHHKVVGEEEEHAEGKKVYPSYSSVLTQIVLLDIVFSLDSIITAVGMVRGHIWVMVVAIILSVVVMMIFAEPVSRFIQKNPTLKMLALSFLILIGVMLVAEGAGSEIEKGYIYFAIAFSLIVEFLNIRVRKMTGKKPTSVPKGEPDRVTT
jgi:predicted tellurium resistance membrane protein TerC